MWFLFLPCLVQSARVVVTFSSWDLAIQSTDLIGVEHTVVKQYGRRLVLDTDQAVNISNWPGIERIEEDNLIQSDNLTVSLADTVPQWNLQGPFGIEAPSFRGSGVVAVLDTGLSLAGRGIIGTVLPGYDFISDVSISKDGDGRDSDPTDPGDAGVSCPTSSWHGTKVASIVASNHSSMRGVAPGVSLMPVRVLGECGSGYASDITDAIVWSAGGRINGIADNPRPAKVISMSLAGMSSCPSYLQSAIDQAIGLGALIIAAAGNDADLASKYFPGNCRGALSVAASTRSGNLAFYSNRGSPVAFSAPGGDSVDPIKVLDGNLIIKYGMGTSYAVPHVTGLAALGMQMNLTLRKFLNQSVVVAGCTGLGGGGVVSANSLALVHGTQSYGCNAAQNEKVLDNGYNTCECDAFSYLNSFSVYGGASYLTCVPLGSTMVFFVDDDQIHLFSCTQCSYGSYNPTCVAACTDTCNLLSAGSCVPCPYGFSCYGPFSTLCEPGTYSPTGTMDCLPCQANSWSDYGAAKCDCSAGMYPLGETCTMCPAGSISEYGTECTSCGSGNYDVDRIMCVSCTQCWPGTRTAQACTAGADAVCADCPTGTYGPNGVSCVACPAGYVNPSTGQSECTPCSAGTYNPTGSTVCLTCISGYYSAAAATSCIPCGPGTLSAAGATACETCTAGKYLFVSMTPSCVSCSAGTYSSVNAATVCTNCPAGLSSLSGASACTLCPAGKYFVSGACTNCAAGTYSAAQATVCTSCAVGTSSVAGSSSCTPCPIGTGACAACSAGITYANTAGQTACTACSACGAGTYASTSCVATSNTVCSAVRECPGGTVLRTVAGSPILDSTGNYQCTSCLTCPSGSIQYQACTPLAQTICARCSDGTYQLGGTCVSAIPAGYRPATMLVPKSALDQFTDNTQAFPVRELTGSVLSWASAVSLNIMAQCGC